MLRFAAIFLTSLLLSACNRPTVISPGESRIEQNEKQRGPVEGKFKIRVLPQSPAPAPGPSAFTEPEPVATLAVFAPKPAEPDPPAGMPEAIRDTAKAAMDKGVAVEIEGEWREGGTSQRDGKAEGRSPGFDGDSDTAKTFKAETPQFRLFGKGGGSTAAGGSADVSFQIGGTKIGGLVAWLVGFGLLAMAGGAVGAFAVPGSRRLFVYIGVGGAVLVGSALIVEHAPWILILLALGAVGFGVHLILKERKDARAVDAMKYVTGAVEKFEKAHPEWGAALKQFIENEMPSGDYGRLDLAVNEAKAKAIKETK